MTVETLKTYEIIEKRKIDDIESMSYLLRHKKTGARVALLSNDDENKVFYIGFRTPPKDSTGVPHIMEHSVLCGSEAFPLKDPFVELVKGSLNTFLNAMTYPDKTMYPVASCNDKDFQNLMHVYMDAVFHPNIYSKKSIFMQEGWHYELEDDKLSVNGVVYNEMKGAFSSPDDVLEREVMSSLFPHTTYGVESGGDPECIPDLTYEDFLAFHGKYYHPSNSYIYLYGNMDMAEKLEFIDREYLSKYDALEVDSEIGFEQPFKEPVRVVKPCPVAEGESLEDNTYLSWNVVLGDSLDRELYIAMDALDEAICSMPGAPLKQTLIDKGIGTDVYSIYSNGVKQPYYGIVAKGVSVDKEQEFVDTVQQVLEDLATNGVDKKSLLAALNRMEFRYREADFGSYPKGLMYGLQMMDSWLYDDTLPFIHIEANDTYKALKEKLNTDYYEQLIRKYFLNNNHHSVVILKPQEGYMEEKEKAFQDKLDAIKNGMSAAEIESIKKDCEALAAFRETEDSKENLEKLPLLTRADMKQKSNPIILEKQEVAGVTYLTHDIFTNGIGYVRVLFKMADLPGEYYPYAGLLRGLLGMVSTKKYSYQDLNNEMNLVAGGFSFGLGTYGDRLDDLACLATMEVKIKALYEKLPAAMELLHEILFQSDFSDAKRIFDCLQEGKSSMQSGMTSSGHSTAVMRAGSYGSKAAKYNDDTSGITFYRFVDDLITNYEDKKELLQEKLVETAKMLFRPENLIVDFIGDSKEAAGFAAQIENLVKALYTCPVKKESYEPVLVKKQEGFMTSGQVQYVCRSGNFKKKGLPYHGSLRVLKVIMGYEYLWTNIRVKGGAYGCMCGFSEGGDGYFVSYRDPNLEKTVQVYENAPDAIAAFDADERTMTKYIIGTFSNLDMPLTPQTKGSRALACYLSNTTWEMLQKEREEILNCSVEDIQKLSAYLKAILEDEYFCVVGNASKIKEAESMFGTIENLF